MSTSFTVGDQEYFAYFRDKAGKEGRGILITENPRGRGDVIHYLSEAKTIDGVWIGNHAAAMGLTGVASQKEAATLFELGKHPVTGQRLGKKPAEYVSLDARVARRMEELADTGQLYGLGTAAIDAIRVSERRRLQRENQDRRATTCVDLTHAATKSVSVLYGMYLASGQTENAEELLAAVNRAFARSNEKFQREFLKTRLGGRGTQAVAQVDVEGGAVGVGYLHETARPAMGLPAMPHLHQHSLFSTRVQVYDPRTQELKWLQMDTATIREARQVLAAYTDLAVEQELAKLGLTFVTPEHELSKPVGEQNREIAGLHDEQLLRAWSARSEQIEQEAKTLLEAFVARTGRQPTQTEEVRLYKQAHLTTREAKQGNRAEELASWANVAEQTLGSDWRTKLDALTAGRSAAHRDHVELSFEQRRDLAAQAVAELEAEGRSTWTRNHAHARVVKILKGAYGARLDPAGVDELIASVTRMAVDEFSVGCNGYQAVEGQVGSEVSRRADGTSVFVRHGEQLFTTASILRKEADMVAWARDSDVDRRISLRSFEEAVRYWAEVDGHELAPDQYAAARHLASSGRSLDAMVGPAGTGKTTTLKVVAKAAQLDGRKVVGLTLAQAAADVMKEGAKLDEVYNMAEFRTRVDHGLMGFEAGACYVVDEASAVSLPDLHALVEDARAAGATVMLTGDFRQHGTVAGAGGTLRLIHDEAPGAELTTIWRFWTTDENGKRVLDVDYAELTRRVRAGDVTASAAMMERGMVKFGTREEMEAAAIADWEANLAQGLHAVLPVRSNEQRADLARRGIEAMKNGGHLGDHTGWTLRDGTDVYVGGFVMARKTTGDLRFAPDDNNGGRGQKVSNRHTFRVVGYNADAGTLRCKSELNGKVIELPRDYWAKHMESSIAVTGLGVQGLTCDADHAIVSAGATNADLYVAITRGTKAHTVYVITDELDAGGETSAKFRNPEEMLASIIRRDASDKAASAHLADDWDTARNLPTLSARHRYYVDLARVTARKSAEQVVRDALPDHEADWVLTAEAWPTLADRIVDLQLAEVDVTAAVMDTVTDRGLEDAADPAKVLAWRLADYQPADAAAATADAASVVVPWLRTPDLPVEGTAAEAEAMRAYELAAVQRATYLADHALRERVGWLAELGDVPVEGPERQQYLAAVAAAAAYRENYSVEADTMLGSVAEETPAEQQLAHAHVAALVDRYMRRHEVAPADDLVLATTAAREVSFPDRAFAAGVGPAPSAAEFPISAPEPVPYWQRTFGAVSDETLNAQLRALVDREIPAVERNLARMTGDLATVTARYREARGVAAAGGGKAVRALHEEKARLDAQEALQAELVRARAERAAARTEADAKLARAAELDGAGRGARGEVQSAMEAQRLRMEHVTLMAELRRLDATVDQLTRDAGPDADWPRVRAARDELVTRWSQHLEIAEAADAAAVDTLRLEVRRVSEAIGKAETRLTQTRSEAAQISAEVALRAEQPEPLRAEETAQRQLLDQIRAAEARQAADAQTAVGVEDRGTGADVTGPRVDRDGPEASGLPWA